MFCGKCGTEVPDGYEFCMKCGTKVEQTQEANTDIVKKKSKKWLIPVIVVIVLALIAIIAIFFMNDSKKRNGLYMNIPWETSFEDIKSIAKKNNNGEEAMIVEDKALASYIIENYEGNEGVTTMIIFDCKNNNTLRCVQLFISIGEESIYTDDQLYDKYVNELTNLYGDSEKGITDETWITKKSQIKLIHLADDMYILEYRDLNALDD